MIKNKYVHDSKLFMLLQALNGDEIKEFTLWLASPVHNTSAQVRQLYEGIKKHERQFGHTITKFDMLRYSGAIPIPVKQRELHPQEEITVRQLMHKLSTQVQEYLSWRTYEQNEFEKKRFHIQSLYNKKMYPIMHTELLRAEKKLTTSSLYEIPYRDAVFQLNEKKFILEVTMLNSKKGKINGQQLIDSLRHSWLSKILKYYCALMNIEKLLKVTYKYPLMELIDEYMKSDNDDKNIPGIRVYYSLFKLLRDNDAQYFYDLKKYLLVHLNNFSIEEIRNFLTHMINYCTRAIRAGKLTFQEERHEIFESGLKIKCWSTNIYFPTALFRIIVINGIALNKIEWTKKFITEHSETLEPSVQADITNYCYALLHFHKKEFETAHRFLTKIQIIKNMFNLNPANYNTVQYRVLLIRIYYEMKDMDIHNIDTHPINYELEAVRHYTSKRNKRISESIRISYNNFVKMFKRILDRHKKRIMGKKLPPSNIQKLKQQLAKITPLVEREWLEEKIDELL